MPKPLKHGGGGNRQTVTTTHLSAQQASHLLAAASHALVIGKPLTRHLTVRLERQGVTDANAAKAIGRLLKLLRDDVTKKTGATIAYVWSRERGPEIGHHVHLLLHLPAGYRWRGHNVKSWVERVSGKPYQTGTIKTTRIGGTASAHETNPALYLTNLATVMGYVLKGSDDNAVDFLSLTRVKSQGRIIGKRCGWSENIGTTARTRHSQPDKRAMPL